MIFYSKNVFSFEGNHNWDPIYLWLQAIGADNRNFLATLDANAKRPDQVWQNTRGERLRIPAGFTMENVYPRQPYLGVPDGGFKYGCVDNINPVLEEIFVLLGQRTNKQKVVFIMQIAACYPGGGAEPEPMDQCPEYGWYSMELPNLVETFIDLHTRRSGERDLIEVLWKGMASRRVLLAEEDLINDLGWNMSITPIEEDQASFPNCKSLIPGGVTKYTLRRRKFIGRLTTQDPSPFSDIYILTTVDRERYL